LGREGNIAISIPISGPFYVRSDEDIQRLASEIKNMLLEGYSSKVGRTNIFGV